MTTPVSNLSNTTDGGGVAAGGLPYTVWQSTLIVLLCSLIVVGTVIGNTLVCTAVSIVRKLRTPSNWLIVSLAVADLLVALLVMPLAIVYEIQGYWPLNRAICDAWTSLDVLLCTASILNLCAISIDRYFVITRPFQYAIKRTPKHMVAMIAAVWVLSALISIPPLFGWRQELPPGVCELTQAIGYQFYATIGAFYLPLVIMIVIYGRIFAVSKRIADAEARTMPVSLSAATTGLNSRSGSTAVFDAASLSGGAGPKQRTDTNSGRALLEVEKSRRQNSIESNDHQQIQAPVTGAAGIRKNLSFARPAPSRVSSTTRESKVTKTLGVIMGAFTICWLPFFILALVRPFCQEYHLCEPIPVWLTSLFLWLGFANSFLNPIIYARFNRDFRTPFKEILLCRCRDINRRLRNESYEEQFGTAATLHSQPVLADTAAGRARQRPPSFVLTAAESAAAGRPSSVEIPQTSTTTAPSVELADRASNSAVVDASVHNGVH